MRTTSSIEVNAHSWKFLWKAHWRKEFIRTFNRVHHGIGKKCLPAATPRQMRTAAAILNRLKGHKGLLLADDVGTGKTTVAAWVILVFAKGGRSVSVLAPNKSMRRRWEEEIEWLLAAIAAMEYPRNSKQRDRRKRELSRHIKFSTHTSVSKPAHQKMLKRDLVVIDEAHRAKNENTKFAKSLDRVPKRTRLLILTATPFSLSIAELNNLLKRIGAERETLTACGNYAKTLEELWAGERIGRHHEIATGLLQSIKAARNAIRELVFRTSVSELPAAERQLYGEKQPWSISVPRASNEHLKLLAQMDRLGDVGELKRQHNDPRYHQGWAQIDQVLARKKPNGNDWGVFRLHRKRALRLRRGLEHHPKIVSVAKAVKEVTDEGEKVVVFCDHHATAAEIAVGLVENLGERERVQQERRRILQRALRDALGRQPPVKAALDSDEEAGKALRNYCEWLSSPGLGAQGTH